VLAARGHEIGEADFAVCGDKGGLDDHGAWQVSAASLLDFVFGTDAPEAVAGGAEKGGEAGAGGKIGPAEPVDGAVKADQGGGLAVADDGVVFNPRAVEGLGLLLLEPLWHRPSETACVCFALVWMRVSPRWL
jgi:hypothetical protein